MTAMFFDQRDHEMIQIVEQVYNTPAIPEYVRSLYYPFFHPLGIKELAESKGLRTAYAIVNLLASMERGGFDNRLQALKGLKDDIFSAIDGSMPMNTARVMLQIMKELVRARGNYPYQLQLAHDFRMAAFGKPRVVRQFLDHYHLLEMPEEWNQITFDDHVHDANTAGRKTPTHLIMDAWIKGIRRLRVIYYHYIEPKFAAELIEAARIMEIDLRIGIEFRDEYICFVWVSRGLPDVQAFFCFLSEPHVVDFMAQGKAVVKFQEDCVLALLERFNTSCLKQLCKDLDIQMDEIHAGTFLEFAHPGQASALYLAEYIHAMVLEAAAKRGKKADPEKSERIKALGVMDIMSQYLCPSCGSDVFRYFIDQHSPSIPDRLKKGFLPLLGQIQSLHHEFRITLNLDRLEPEDVLELLYESRGLITRIEILNLKDFNDQKIKKITGVNELQKSINEGSLLKLKQVVREIIRRAQDSGRASGERMERFMEILHDIDGLRSMYSIHPLKSRIGSHSIGKPHRAFGMGFGVLETLGPRAGAKVAAQASTRLVLPVKARVLKQITTVHFNGRLARYLPGFYPLFLKEKQDWAFESYSLNMEEKGNIVTLGQ
ncbi:MAG: hypothetical protein HUK40_10270 [Desulfobacter sp.]|nr:hypothetical protein [Desulfobacter sp.]